MGNFRILGWITGPAIGDHIFKEIDCVKTFRAYANQIFNWITAATFPDSAHWIWLGFEGRAALGAAGLDKRTEIHLCRWVNS